ncbi:MAG: hypothetical protein GVY15_07370 [Bacteroidetes bacterium]|nr:hypothetical protein [Bacteroidota bacterium]
MRDTTENTPEEQPSEEDVDLNAAFEAATPAAEAERRAQTLAEAKASLQQQLLQQLYDDVVAELGSPEAMARRVMEEYAAAFRDALAEAQETLAELVLQNLTERMENRLADTDAVAHTALDRVDEDQQAAVQQRMQALLQQQLMDEALASVHEQLAEPSSKGRVQSLLQSLTTPDADAAPAPGAAGPEQAVAPPAATDAATDTAADAEAAAEPASASAADTDADAEPADDGAAAEESAAEEATEASAAAEEPVVDIPFPDAPEPAEEAEGSAAPEEETFDPWVPDAEASTSAASTAGGDGTGGTPEAPGQMRMSEYMRKKSLGAYFQNSREIRVRVRCTPRALQQELDSAEGALTDALTALPDIMARAAREGMQHGAQQEVLSIAKHVGERCHNALLRHAEDCLRNPINLSVDGGAQLVLDTLYYLPKDQYDAFEQTLEKLKAEYEPLSFTFTVSEQEEA